MNDYDFESLNIGTSASFSCTVTKEMQDQFRHITGDNNPLHVDVAYAKAKGFPGVVVYGLLVSSFYSTLCGVHLPGRKCLLHGVDVQFAKPCFIGDSLTIHGEITHLSPSVKQIEIKASISNQNGVKISQAKIRAGLIA